MKQYSFIYSTEFEMMDFFYQNSINSSGKYLVIINSSNLLKEEIEPIISSISKTLLNAKIIGSSCAGVIHSGKQYDEATLITIIESTKLDFEVYSFKIKDEKGNIKKSRKLAMETHEVFKTFQDSFMICFYPPKFSYPSSFINELNKFEPYTIIGGGGYSVKNDEEKYPAYVICGTDILENSIVISSIRGETLFKFEGSVAGVDSIGVKYTVTSVENQHILEIDNKPARQWYQNLIGKDFLDNDPYICFQFPIVRAHSDRSVLNVIYEGFPFMNEKYKDCIYAFDTIAENETITAGYINPKKSTDDIMALYKKISDSPCEVLLGFSCMTRRNILQNCSKWELQPFESTQMTGAFLAGEIISNDGVNEYANSTVCIATLSEKMSFRCHLNEQALNDMSNIQYDNIQLVNYFLSNAQSELKKEIINEKNKFINNLTEDKKTGIPNLTKYAYDLKIKKYNKAALIKLNNENIIRVFVNKSNFYLYLQNMYNTANELLDDNLYSFYVFNELSLLITANDDVSISDFIEKMEKLVTLLDEKEYTGYIPIHKISIVSSKRNLINNFNLSNMRQIRNNLEIYLEDEEKKRVNNELRMLDIINNAITHKMVIPYYQGIHNNETNKIDIYEALMRITDENGKVYMPNEFLELSKEYKLYERLSKLMISKVFDEFENIDASVTINLNVQDLYNYEIIKLISSNLKNSLHPEKYIFEIVESEEIKDYEYLKQFVDNIHSAGGKIAIDDFGTGYSNFFNLLKIDTDFIKLSGEIVKEMPNDKSCQDFTNMITNYAHDKNISVIAEHVKDEEIQNIIKNFNVLYSQGFYFSKPTPLVKLQEEKKLAVIEKNLMTNPFFRKYAQNEGVLYDSLTHVISREIILNYADWLCQNDKKFTFCLIDIDNFKNVNDSYGHLIGDRVLVRVANELSLMLLGKGIVGRYGGDEFIVILEDIIEYKEVWETFSNLRSNVSHIIFDEMPELCISITAGMSRMPIDSLSLTDLFEKADKALYRGKTKGRSCFIIYLHEKHANIELKTKNDKNENPIDNIITAFDFFKNNDDISFGINRLFQFFIAKFMFDQVAIETKNDTIFKVCHSLSKSKNINHIGYDILANSLNEKGYFAINNFEVNAKNMSKELVDAISKEGYKSMLCCKIAAFGVEYGILRIQMSNAIRLWQTSEIALIITLCDLIAILLHDKKIKFEDL